MKRTYIVPILSFILSMVPLSFFTYSGTLDIYEFYSKNMRTPLFMGFLTIGGFLLSLKTFILIKLKEDLYENDRYKKRISEMRLLNPKLTLYGPLQRLGTFLVYCVFGAFLCSVIQFTLGIIECDYVAAFCISIAVASMSVVFLAWWEIRKNLKDWFSLLQDDDEKNDGFKAEEPNSNHF